MKILHIDSCALGDNSTSRRAGAALVSIMQEESPSARVVYRDLAAAPLSHVSGPLLRVMRREWDVYTNEQRIERGSAAQRCAAQRIPRSRRAGDGRAHAQPVGAVHTQSVAGPSAANRLHL